MHNPFYECPFYEDIEGHLNSQAQHVQSNVLAPAREDVTFSISNLYESISINIERDQIGDGQDSHHTAEESEIRNGENVDGVESDLEGEEGYTPMHTPIASTITSTRESINTRITSIRDSISTWV